MTRYPVNRGLRRPRGRSGRVQKISPLPVFDPRTAQPAASRYYDYAIPARITSKAKSPTQWLYTVELVTLGVMKDVLYIH